MTIRRTLAAIASLTAATIALAACDTHPNHHASATSGAPTSTARSTTTGQQPSSVIPTESPQSATPSVTPNPTLTPPPISAVATATTSPTLVARAWATAANSSTYLDASAGEWTTRTKPFVAGAEASTEAQQASGGGGSTWTQIQADKCVTSLQGLTAAIPSDAPTGPDTHVVYVAATIALSCATNAVQLTPYAVQLIVNRIGGRWLVTNVTY